MKKIIGVYKIEDGCAIHPLIRDSRKVAILLKGEKDVLIALEHGRHENNILKSSVKPGTKFMLGSKEIELN